MLEPARGLIGYSHAIMPNPMTKLMICNIGIGMTMGLSDLVKKSKKILGQRKPSNAAHTWSVRGHGVRCWALMCGSWRVG